MTGKAAGERKVVGGDRRSGKDRRTKDLGPPGKTERRRSLESRKPDVTEIEMSATDWSALEQLPVPPRK
jgi:hypothetical protein